MSVQIATRVSDELGARLRVLMEREQRSMGAILRLALVAYADRAGGAVEQALGKGGPTQAGGEHAADPNFGRSLSAPAEQPEGSLEVEQREVDRLIGVAHENRTREAVRQERAEAVPDRSPAKSYRQHVPGPNVENIRSSSQREFRPYPKGGKR